MKIFWQLLLQLVLIGLNAFFACAEIAVLSLNEARLAQLEEQGNKKARRLAKLTKDPARFLATIQVAITLAGFFGSAFAADNFAGPLTDALWHTGSPLSREALHTISLVVVTLILSFFTLVLGELVPKRVAMKKAEALSLSMAGIIGTLSVLFRPIVWLLSVSTNGVLRLIGIDPNGALEGEIYGAMPTGMESTIKVRVGGFLLTGVVFGSSLFTIGTEVPLSVTGDQIMLFDRKSGQCITSGTLNF